MDRTDPDAPQPLIGRDDSKPGYWAEAAFDNPWSRGRRNSYNNETTLYELRQGHLLREPGLRESRAHFDGPRFYRAVGSKTENVEALLAQATGPKVVPEQQCDACKQEKGPFVSCVIAPGSFRECANCRWSQQGHRCSFLSLPADTEIEVVDEAPMDLTQELQKLRVARGEAMAYIQRIDHRIERILEIMAAQGTDSSSRVN